MRKTSDLPSVTESVPESAPSRREFVRTMAHAVALGLWPLSTAAGTLGGGSAAVSAELRVLTGDEAAIYDVWCDELAPGAAQQGAARYLDAQLAAAREDSLLLLRVLANPPFEEFYRQGITAIGQEARARFGDDASFVALAGDQRREIVEAAAADQTVAWQNPPPSFFYFVSRADAVDVAYGTEEGFRRLRVPYLPHIRPPAPW